MRIAIVLFVLIVPGCASITQTEHNAPADSDVSRYAYIESGLESDQAAEVDFCEFDRRNFWLHQLVLHKLKESSRRELGSEAEAPHEPLVSLQSQRICRGAFCSKPFFALQKCRLRLKPGHYRIHYQVWSTALRGTIWLQPGHTYIARSQVVNNRDVHDSFRTWLEDQMTKEIVARGNNAFNLLAIPIASFENEIMAKKFTPKPNMSRIYVFELNQRVRPYLISFNGRVMGELSSMTFFIWDVPPGNHKLRAGDFFEYGEHLYSSTVEINATSGSVHYVELTDGLSSGLRLIEVEAKTGQEGVLQSDMVRSDESDDVDGFDWFTAYRIGLQRSFCRTGSEFRGRFPTDPAACWRTALNKADACKARFESEIPIMLSRLDTEYWGRKIRACSLGEQE